MTTRAELTDEQVDKAFGYAIGGATKGERAIARHFYALGLAAQVKVSIPTNTMEQEYATHYRRGYAAGLAARGEPVAQNDANRALDLLATMFDAYENGDPCYEDGDPELNYMGPAFKLDDDTFTECADLLNRLRPVTTPAAPPTEGSGE